MCVSVALLPIVFGGISWIDRLDLFQCLDVSTTTRSVTHRLAFPKQNKGQDRAIKHLLGKFGWKETNEHFTILLGKRIFGRLLNTELPLMYLFRHTNVQ